MMDLLTKRDLESLIEESSGKTLSIYIPTEKVGRETEEGRIHLKNALKEAETMLVEAGKSPQAIERFLAGARALTNDSLFWQHQSEGLALFIDGNATESYRLPIKFEPFVDYDDIPYIKPLFPLFVENRLFYILALSQKNIRLIRCTHYSAEECPLDDLPTSMEEHNTFEDPDTHQIHERLNDQTGNRQAAGYVGHGVDSVDNKERIAHFFHEIDHGLPESLDDLQAPIILAGVDYLASLYREITTLKNVLGTGISGNPDALSKEALLEKAWPLVADQLDDQIDRILERYGVLKQKDRAQDQLEAIAASAINGRIDTLVLAKGTHLWGFFDYQTQKVSPAPEHEGVDLANFVALHAFMSGAQVYAIEKDRMPGEHKALALLRY